MRNLDAEDDRHLAVVDHLARLGRCLDDAEPALAGAAFLRVDVVLHVAHELDLADRAFHLVASRRIRQLAEIRYYRTQIVAEIVGGDRGGFEPAQHFVLDHVVDHQPQAGEPRALNPAVVHRFMRQRIAPRPVDEGWPTLGIVRTERRTVWPRSEEHTSELQSLMRISYAVFCLKK